MGDPFCFAPTHWIRWLFRYPSQERCPKSSNYTSDGDEKLPELNDRQICSEMLQSLLTLPATKIWKPVKSVV